MSRNLKALGLALVAALALAAISAQSASAVVEHSFRSDASNEKTVATIQQDGNHVFRVQTGGASVTCTTATFSGTYIGNTVDYVTVHPKFSSCTFGGAEATIHTDGCNFIFDSDTTSGGHFSGEHATASLECEAGHVIRITASCEIIFASTHSSVPVNQSMHGMRYDAVTHSSKSSITSSGTVGNIHYTTKGGFACTLIGKSEGTYTTGIYEGKGSATGYEDPGDSATQRTGTTTTGTTWHHSTQVNISLSTPT